MKNALYFSLMITGLAGFAVWQFHFDQQGGAGETRPTELAQIMPKPSESEVIETNPAIEFDPAKEKITLPIRLNSDEVVIDKTPSPVDATKAYVNTADPEKVMEYYATLRSARAELLQNRFNQELQDPTWSKELTQRLTEAYRLVPGLPKLQLSKSDCRETICALHVDMNKGAYKKYAPYMQHIGMVLGTDTWVHHDALPDTAIIYVARADTELPELNSNGIYSTESTTLDSSTE